MFMESKGTGKAKIEVIHFQTQIIISKGKKKEHYLSIQLNSNS